MPVAIDAKAPSTKPIAITKSDSTDLSTSGIRAIYVGTSGDLAVIGVDDATNSGAGTAVTFKSVPSGSIVPVTPKRVMSTGTTAADLVGLV